MSDFKFDPKQLEETKASVEKTLEKFKQAKGDLLCMDDSGNVNILDTFNRFQNIFQNLGYTLESLSRQINYLSEGFYEHVSKGHLPPAPGPAAMKSAIKALGWNEDFNVEPKTLYAGLKDGAVTFDGKRIEF